MSLKETKNPPLRSMACFSVCTLDLSVRAGLRVGLNSVLITLWTLAYISI